MSSDNLPSDMALSNQKSSVTSGEVLDTISSLKNANYLKKNFV